MTNLDFLFMDGPNSLLGRLALEKLWPQQYGAMRAMVEAPLRANVSVKIGGNGKVPVMVNKLNSCQQGRICVDKVMSQTGAQREVAVHVQPKLDLQKRRLPELSYKLKGNTQQKYPQLYNGDKSEVNIGPPVKIPCGVEDKYEIGLDENSFTEIKYII